MVDKELDQRERNLGGGVQCGSVVTKKNRGVGGGRRGLVGAHLFCETTESPSRVQGRMGLGGGLIV